MSMNVGAHSGSKNADPEAMMELNMTPLIDIMLVLIITIPRQNHSVNLNMPVGQPPLHASDRVVVIDVDFDGTILWNGVAIPDRAALEATLANVTAQPDQPEVQLRANKPVS